MKVAAVARIVSMIFYANVSAVWSSVTTSLLFPLPPPPPSLVMLMCGLSNATAAKSFQLVVFLL